MTKAFKNMRGEWKCEDEVALPDNCVLRISTHKTYGGELVTSATAGKVEGGFFSYMMYQDYSKRVLTFRYPRITAKVIETQHATVMEQIEDVKASVAAFYAEKATV